VNNSWPLVPLGDLLTHRKEFVQISDFENYKRCRVQLHAKGIVLRDTITGAEIKTKEQQICRAGEFLVAEIDAKVGGFGVVPDELDGSIVSSHYFLFEVNEGKLHARFLDYFVRTPFFRDQVSARGSTNYAAIRPHHVLQYQIPLPPLPEQRRILARIEELAVKIYEMQGLRQKAEEAVGVLLQAEKRKRLMPLAHWQKLKLREIAELRYGISEAISKATDPALGRPIIRMANLSLNGDLDLSDLRYIAVPPAEEEQFKLRPGDLLLNWRSGSQQHVGKTALFDRAGTFLHASFLLRIRCNSQLVIPEFLKLSLNFMRAEGVFIDAQRFQVNTKLNASEFGEYVINTPNIEEQRHLVAELIALETQVNALKKLQSETAAELDAFLPSVLDKAFSGNL
jgi:type I restriction enzyme, S subunit